MELVLVQGVRVLDYTDSSTFMYSDPLIRLDPLYWPIVIDA